MAAALEDAGIKLVDVLTKVVERHTGREGLTMEQIAEFNRHVNPESEEN